MLYLSRISSSSFEASGSAPCFLRDENLLITFIVLFVGKFHHFGARLAQKSWKINVRIKKNFYLKIKKITVATLDSEGASEELAPRQQPHNSLRKSTMVTGCTSLYIYCYLSPPAHFSSNARDWWPLSNKCRNVTRKTCAAPPRGLTDGLQNFNRLQSKLKYLKKSFATF